LSGQSAGTQGGKRRDLHTCRARDFGENLLLALRGGEKWTWSNLVEVSERQGKKKTVREKEKNISLTTTRKELFCLTSF